MQGRSEAEYPWFKIHSRGWLEGSIRSQLTSAERGIWADLLAMANKSRVRGTICRAKDIPYTLSELCEYLKVSQVELQSTISKCCNDSNAAGDGRRLYTDAAGCLVIGNWEQYQSTPCNKERHQETSEMRQLRMKRNALQYFQEHPDEIPSQVKVVEQVDSQDGSVLSAIAYPPGSLPEKPSAERVKGKRAKR